MGWLVAAALLLGLALLPISIRLAYDTSGARVLLGIGPIRIPIIPRNKAAKNKKSKEKTAEVTQSSKGSADKGGNLSDFLPLLEKVLALITQLRRRLVVTDLELKICMTGDDPCDLSIQYGRAWIALGNLVPQLERLFVLKKRNVALLCDYTSDESYALAHAVLRISLGHLLWIAIFHGRHILKQYMKIYNERKGGTDI